MKLIKNTTDVSLDIPAARAIINDLKMEKMDASTEEIEIFQSSQDDVSGKIVSTIAIEKSTEKVVFTMLEFGKV